MFRQLIDAGELLEVNFLRVGSIVETEIVSCNISSRLPVPDLDAVLWALGNLLCSDDISARIGLFTLRNPDLPIHFLGAKGQVIAFGAADHPAAKVLYVN